MDREHAESIVRIITADACEKARKNLTAEVGELREAVVRLVNSLNLDERFVEQFDMDVECEIQLRDNKPRVEFDSHGESGNIFYILGMCQKALNNETLYKSIFENVKKTNYPGALAEIRKHINLVDIAGEL